MWNMDYLPGSDEGYIKLGSNTWEIMGGNNQTVRMLKSVGYKYVYAGGREYCKKYADKCLTGIGILQGAPWVILHSTPIPAFLYYVSDKIYTSLFIKNNLMPMKQAVKDIGALKFSPLFVFYHEMAVHNSMYNADCTFRNRLAVDELERVDNAQRMLSSWKAYASSIQCVNETLKGLVSKILAKDKDAIIVISADHGANFKPIKESTDPKILEDFAYLRERSATFSSWRLPVRCQKWLYDSMSNVNHFRLITSCILNKEPKFLPFKSYYPLTPGSTDSGRVISVPVSVFEDK